jgi:glycosyltransferase involved in cell wall biosynthesis
MNDEPQRHVGRPTVIFAMEWVPQYRQEFYRRLRHELDHRGIEMRLVHGDPPASRRGRKDARVIDWAEFVPNRLWTIRGLELTLQPILGRLRKADLVVLQQETGLVLNYAMFVLSRLGGPLVALWGHGHNFNPLEANGPAERIKSTVTKWADWVFAYTERSRQVFQSIGVRPERITVVQNSLDTSDIDHPSDPMSPEIVDLVAELTATDATVGWIVSALDRWKRVPFLLEILDAVADRIDNFHFLVLGAGDDDAVLRNGAESRPWLHVLGPRFGADKAALGRLAAVTIHPGLVGLHVIDSFATQTPMVIADLPYHSHEVGYLTDDNSLTLPPDVDAERYAGEVVDLLGDEKRLSELRVGCRRAAEFYTLDAMVDNFADGVESALALRAGR